jgi:hypothetical protein
MCAVPEHDMTLWRRVAGHIAALIMPMFGFVVLNVGYTVVISPPCNDCHAHVGVPFAYADDGANDGGGGLIWSGVVAGTLVILATSSALAVAFQRLFSAKRL